MQQKISVTQARALRLVRLGLAPQAPGAPVLQTPGEVASHHLAMQAQDFGSAQWAIASRLTQRHVTKTEVVAAFNDGSLIRTWPMRGTVHAMAAADARWLLDLCGPIALRGVERRWDHLGMTHDFVQQVEKVAVALLRGGRNATRDELIAACQKAGLDFSLAQRRYHAVWHVCQVGTTLLGPIRGNDNALVLTEEYLPNASRYDSDAALQLLGARYLAARGPASVDDLQHWTKLTKTQCRKAFAAVDDAVSVQIEGRGGGTGLTEYVVRASDLEHLKDLRFGDTVPRALAVAGFDEHLLGYRDRSLVLDAEHATKVDPGRNGVFRPTVVFDGKVVGTWKRRLLTTTAPVEVSLFAPMKTADRKAITRAFDPWGHFIGREPVVSFG